MASAVSKAAGAAGRMATQAGKAMKGSGDETVLKKGARRDPELYVRSLDIHSEMSGS